MKLTTRSRTSHILIAFYQVMHVQILQNMNQRSTLNTFNTFKFIMFYLFYLTGNNYGVGPDGRGCVGCGSQEEFYGCADISIGNNGQPPLVTAKPTKMPTFRPKTVQPVTTRRPLITFRPVVTFQPFFTNKPVQTAKTFRPFVTNAPVQTARPGLLVCKAINYWAGVDALDQWCTVECRKGNCPPTACTCQTLGR